MEYIELSQGKDEAYASYTYCYTESMKHFPTSVEVVSHMKLLKAIEVFKQKLVGNKGSDLYKTKVWTIFLNNAIRRFLLFLSALYKYYDISKKFPRGYGQNTPQNPSPDATSRPVKASKTVICATKYYDGPNESQLVYEANENHQAWGKLFETWLPPLDIIIVWHSLLLNPKSCYDNFVKLKFLQFSNFPFPLKLINQSINENFEFKPNRQLQLKYLDIIKTFAEDSNDLIYDILPDFNISQPLVTIYCPICWSALVYDYPLTTTENTGFADKDFKVTVKDSVCKCPFVSTISHDELRKRQLFADLKANVCLAGVIKNWSEVISSCSQSMNDPLNFNHVIKTIIKDTINFNDKFKESTLAEFATSFRSKVYQKEIRLILRNYLQIGLSHLTIKHGLFIWEDLLGCIIRQERFTEKINKSGWLVSPNLKSTIDESIVRYGQFLVLIAENREILVPTLDIDLIWHTHQLSQFFYFNQFDNETGVIDHDDKVEVVLLDTNFKKTLRLYKAKFKSDYSYCPCWYCVSNKGKPPSKLFFKKSNSKSDLKDDLQITHTSLHPAIKLPTFFAIEKREQLEKEYSRKSIPWKEDECQTLKIGNKSVFIDSPDHPIVDKCSGLYYTHGGLCCAGEEQKLDTATSEVDFARGLDGRAVEMGNPLTEPSKLYYSTYVASGCGGGF